ncbi:acetate/propionate family kinase [Nocardioides jishulii]|uniref:Acetate kinase n=1 Tax=Nocardioides jishulii TaxID=2575440 RepID=A0A4V5TM71_9ACTN|nr:acetate/propionate family kinase [Nocardioides jishulii]QCX27368.1 acetate/propionate family kinase [Nocardioides jishulii]TKI62173.1 acetate/propionate family kinase [Nocardioides jishulii]
MRVLVVNAGSSTLKLSLREGDTEVADTTIERWEGDGHDDPIRDFVEQHPAPEVTGHRVVHGGPRFTEPVLVDDEVLDYLDSITNLAPLHNPRATAAIREVAKLLPGTPAVACFDTAFHATLPPSASTYALPKEWNERWQLRRYGFHGLSHAYAVRRAAQMLGRDLREMRVVSCHLGAGASLAAVRGGRSVDTTMGFTPLAGLVMVTRSGSVDPGMVLWLIQNGGLAPEHLRDVLEHHSGMRGLSGTSGDLRDVLAARGEGDPDAALAYDVFVHHVRREVGAMAASTQGLDLLVVTGGIGEHSSQLRRDMASGLGYLGISIDEAANEAARGDTDISAPGAVVRTVVVEASEGTEIARQAVQVFEKRRSSA